MPLEITATYENGFLKPDQTLPLKENQRVRITIQTESNQTRELYGLLRWTGDPKILERIAMDSEFGIEECP